MFSLLFDGTNDGLAYLLTKSTNPGLRAAARYHANEKVFRLNKYENCGKILKYFDPLNYIATVVVLTMETR